jgi:pimeloyl-ACP methyl ester carboxylesterase
MRIELDGFAVEVEDHGVGVPVVLLHGYPLSAEIWTPVRPAIEQVARLITPDLRGFGGSDKPAGDYGMSALADDVVQLLDRLDLERVVLGGHSMGGYVALALAEGHPERLLGLVLVGSKASADSAEGRAGRDLAIEAIRTSGGAPFVDGFVPRVVSRSTLERAPRFAAELREIAGLVPDHVLIGCQRGMAERPDRGAMLAGLSVPVLVVVGSEDPFAPPDGARALVASVRDGTLAVIPDAGHTPSVERPIPTANAIVGFLRDKLGASGATSCAVPANTARQEHT